MTRKVQPLQSEDLLLIPAEVAMLFRVNPKTVTRWVGQGRIGATKTLGGHHRFHVEEVRKLLVANYTGGSLHSRLEALDKLIAARDLHTFTATQ